MFETVDDLATAVTSVLSRTGRSGRCTKASPTRWTACGRTFSRPGDPAANGIRIRRVAQNALTDELIAMVPDAEPAVAMPITLAPDGRDPAALGVLLPELTGMGQLGATRRDTGWAGAELSWLDGPRGRVRVARAADGWVSVNSLRHNQLRYALDNVAMIARRDT